MEFKISNIFFIFIGLFGIVSSVQISQVKIKDDKPYLSYDFGTTDDWILECNITLDNGEELQQVQWTFKDYSDTTVGTYTWDKTSGGSASGDLYHTVNLTNQDLQFLEQNYNQNGFYSCSATTNLGTATVENPFEFLVVDLTARSHGSHMSTSDTSCVAEISYVMSPIFPMPTVKLGMYSKSSGGFYQLVPELDLFEIQYSNRSVAYSYNGTVTVDENTPKDASFNIEVGVTKKDETFIVIWSSEDKFSALLDQGCPAIDPMENLKVNYNSDKRSCRGEVKPPTISEDEVQATVTCMDGYSSNFDVTLTCHSSTYQWEPAADMNKFADIKCEKMTDPSEKSDSGKDYNSSLRSSANFGLVAVLAFLMLLKN